MQVMAQHTNYSLIVRIYWLQYREWFINWMAAAAADLGVIHLTISPSLTHNSLSPAEKIVILWVWYLVPPIHGSMYLSLSKAIKRYLDIPIPLRTGAARGQFC